ncbi:soma ferritin-like [Neodiprion pinetum]|uniref:soma ferritin-like n=1 Tax=Neodiprion pinetum TaxID=441929 RepID=UPI001EDE3046|nr:soma ferritin-like [Neodiprion pinetum]
MKYFLMNSKPQSNFNLQTQHYTSRCKDDSSSTSSNAGDPVECGSPPGPWPTGNRVNFRFHPDTEAIMNRQFATEMKAFYYYLSMAGYFGRVDVALPGCESFFKQMHHEEHGHALRFFDYIKMRGGLVNLCSIEAPMNQDWKCPLNAFKVALEIELEVAEKLVETNNIAEKYKDLNASDFIVTGFMEDQMKSVNDIGRLVTVLSGVGDQALGRFMFDKDLLDHYVMPEFNILKKKK